MDSISLITYILENNTTLKFAELDKLSTEALVLIKLHVELENSKTEIKK